MLVSLSSIRGYSVTGAEGELGKVQDSFFDDACWIIRYLVVDTGGWFDKNEVLVSPAAVKDLDMRNNILATGLTQEKIRNGPSVDAERPVSRRIEDELVRHFGWPVYWDPLSIPTQFGVVQAEKDVVVQERGQASLRSTREVLGYDIEAVDGAIGHVEDFIMDGDWKIRYLAIDTRNWLPGRKVLISPQWIHEVRWSERSVHVDLSQEGVRQSPEYEPSHPVNREYETALYDYYGRTQYWV